MDTMAVRLDALIDEQRAFVADASHQLRTPLTALRLRLENLQTRVSTEAAAELDAVIDETTRLAALVADLLQLARADEHAPVEHRRPARPGRGTDRHVVCRRRRAGHLRSRCAAPEDAVLARAVPGAVEQVLDNLLDNALNASPDDGTVRVELDPGSDEHVLAVSDQGPGLSDEDKDRAIRRFWRGDASTPGTGLGLAIASALVTGSVARSSLTDAADHGLRVVVRLPTAVHRGRRSLTAHARRPSAPLTWLGLVDVFVPELPERQSPPAGGSAAVVRSSPSVSSWTSAGVSFDSLWSPKYV